MQKRSYLLFTALVCLSQYTHAQTPTAFNSRMVAITDSIFKLGTSWGGKLDEVSNGSKHYDELKPYRTKAIKYIDLELAELAAMKDVKDSKELRLAVMDFLTFEKGLISNVFTPIENLGPNSTNSDIEDAFSRMEEESKKEEPYLTKVDAAQDAYAKNNGFTVNHEGDKRMD